MNRCGIFNKSGFTLLEVLTVSMLLAFFLVGFYEGSQRMAVGMHSAQNRTEALMQLRRIGNNWRAGQNITGINSGNFLNGTNYTVTSAQSNYSSSVPTSSLTQLAVTVSWSEIDANSKYPRPQYIKDVYFKYGN